MSTYKVIAHETVELEYTIEAESPEHAYAIWHSRDEARGAPEESIIANHFQAVMSGGDDLQPPPLFIDWVKALALEALMSPDLDAKKEDPCAS